MTDTDQSQTTTATETAFGESSSETERLMIGQAGYRTDGTGGIDRYIAEQCRHLDGHLSSDVFDISIRTLTGPTGYFGALLTVLRGWLPFLVCRPDVVHVHSSHSISFLISAP